MLSSEQIESAYRTTRARGDFLASPSSPLRGFLEDIVQGTIERLITMAPHEYREGAFLSFTQKIFNDKLCDYIRLCRRYDHQRMEGTNVVGDGGAFMHKLTMALDMQASFKQSCFTPAETDALWQKFYGGYTWDEIAVLQPIRTGHEWQRWFKDYACPYLRYFLSAYRPQKVCGKPRAETVNILQVEDISPGDKK